MAAADHMDMELRGDVADRADVQLLDRLARGLTQQSHGLTRLQDFVHQNGSLGGGEILKFMQSRPTRDQDQPRKPRVILKTHLTQGPVENDHGAGVEGGIGFEVSGHDASVARRGPGVKR